MIDISLSMVIKLWVFNMLIKVWNGVVGVSVGFVFYVNFKIWDKIIYLVGELILLRCVLSLFLIIVYYCVCLFYF